MRFVHTSEGSDEVVELPDFTVSTTLLPNDGLSLHFFSYGDAALAGSPHTSAGSFQLRNGTETI